MRTDEFYIQQAIEFAKRKNKCWPFSTVLVDNKTGEILVKATDAGHISPAFHSESYALHILSSNFSHNDIEDISMYSTAECDFLSIGTVTNAILSGYNITKIAYAASQKDICNIWNFKYIDISSITQNIETKGGILRNEAVALFKEAKLLQEQIDHPYSGKVYLSSDLNDFYELKPKVNNLKTVSSVHDIKVNAV